MQDFDKTGHRYEAEGTEWQVRLVPEEGEAVGDSDEPHEIIEFRAVDGLKPPRRLAIPTGTFSGMDEKALASAFRMARPIGGDYYGRPGKRMSDMNE